MTSNSTDLSVATHHLHQSVPRTFAAWRAGLAERGLRPLVVVAGSRGKTTVVRLLDAVFREAGLSTATWTDRGVEIEGTPQRGELVPWSRVLARLDAGTLDVAVREIAWSTVRTASLEPCSSPIVVVTNVCANRDACLIQGEAKLASQVLPDLLKVASPAGLVVLNGEDFAVSGDEVPRDRPQWLVGLNRGSPLLRQHWAAGGAAAWVADAALVVGDQSSTRTLAPASSLAFALFGAAGFQIYNALTAAAVAIATGISEPAIRRALAGFRTSHRVMPGSFNVVEVHGATAIVDRPEPSWFLRPILRAVKDRTVGRLVTVAGRLDSVPESDLGEVGRLLGRASQALVLHSESENPARAAGLRQGVAQSDVPPPIVHTPSERRAVNRALAIVRPRDVLLILADRPQSVLRALTRAAEAGQRDMLVAD
jgi:cyanophycin synthetase